jgi:hypothetical protein
MKLPGLGIPAGSFPVVTRWSRRGLDLLVVFNVVAQAVAVLVLFMGREGAPVAPLAGGAVVALFLLVFFYARWMFPGLKTRELLAVVLLKELGVFILVGFAVGVVLLIRFLIS